MAQNGFSQNMLPEYPLEVVGFAFDMGRMMLGQEELPQSASGELHKIYSELRLRKILVLLKCSVSFQQFGGMDADESPICAMDGALRAVASDLNSFQ
ncbi:MAG: hypothetical protein HFH53_11510 [Hespellia sp.]|nr:hypothetical protein [Hespellia sp.]